ncbi:MAG TPA: hypothetical protein PLS49_09740 [Candidatus Woesebacteria bacterium]|nr:hypothetical protein [Candidatus Woesebacteria bacterium]
MQNLGNISVPSKNHKKENKKQTLTLIRTPHSDKHSTYRPAKKFLRNNKIWFMLLLIGGLIVWVYFIPPNNSFAVIPFILLVTTIISLLFSFFGKKIHVFSTLFVLVFLFMCYFIGFDIINTLVLLSFIIGLSTLFRIKD